MKPTRVEIVSQDKIDQFGGLVDDFIERIFDIDGALVTDLSSMWHFDTDRAAVCARVRKAYKVDVSDIASGNLVEVFERIAGKPRS